MSPSHTKKGNKRYRYYVCTNAQKTDWNDCPSKYIPAAEIERFVIEQFKALGAAPSLIAEANQATTRLVCFNRGDRI